MKLIDPNAPAPDTAQAAPQRLAQVFRFNGITKLDLAADVVLQSALDAGLQCAVVLGYDAEGGEFFASSMADGADVLWLLERLKRQLLVAGERDGERFA